MQSRDRQELVQLLIEEPCRTTRSKAHHELGRRAHGRAELDKARTHFREALALDPTDEHSERALADLADTVDKTPRPSVFRRFFGRRNRSTEG